MSRGTLFALTALAVSLGTFFDAEGSTVQIPGHTFKTAKNCERTAPVGNLTVSATFRLSAGVVPKAFGCRALLKVPLAGSVFRKSAKRR